MSGEAKPGIMQTQSKLVLSSLVEPDVHTQDFVTSGALDAAASLGWLTGSVDS